MQQSLLISFIVPAFNAQLTLAGCVGSIVRTMSSCGAGYEVVIVDDGSTDQTPALALALAQQYEEVRVVRQGNGGLGAARNRGINEACGQYLSFVDADDEIELSHGSDFSVLALEPDIVAIPILKVSTSGRTSVYGNVTQRIPFGKTFSTAKEYLRRRNVIPCVCAYLWRREGLQERFSEGIFHEDEEFTVLAMLNGGRLMCCNTLFSYRYFVRQGSITNSEANAQKRKADFQLIIDRLRGYARAHPQYEPYMRAKLLWLRFDYFRLYKVFYKVFYKVIRF